MSQNFILKNIIVLHEPKLHIKGIQMLLDLCMFVLCRKKNYIVSIEN
jgi:hypothetical protein